MLFHPRPACSLVAPLWPSLLEELGVTGKAVLLCWHCRRKFSSWPLRHVPHLGSNDRYGRKPMMLRASIAMTLDHRGALPLSLPSFWLGLRLLNRVFFRLLSPNSTALMPIEVPKDQSGYALELYRQLSWHGTLMRLIGIHCWKSRHAMSFSSSSYFWFLLTFWDIEKTMSPTSKEEQSSWELLHLFSKDILLGTLFDQHDSNDVNLPPIPASLCAGFGKPNNLDLCIPGMIVST